MEITDELISLVVLKVIKKSIISKITMSFRVADEYFNWMKTNKDSIILLLSLHARPFFYVTVL